MTPEQRFAHAETMVSEGRLIQGEWSRIASGGRRLGCALHALGDDVNSATDCPADIAPEWAARLILPMFDGLSGDGLVFFAHNYIPALRMMQGADAAAWRRVMVEVLITSLTVALPHNRDGVVQPVIDLLYREKRGDIPLAAEWMAARAAAYAAWEAGAVDAAAVAARAAAEAAWEAGEAEEEAAGDAAAYAVGAARKGAAAWDTISRAFLAAMMKGGAT